MTPTIIVIMTHFSEFLYKKYLRSLEGKSLQGFLRAQNPKLNQRISTAVH